MSSGEDKVKWTKKQNRLTQKWMDKKIKDHYLKRKDLVDWLTKVGDDEDGLGRLGDREVAEGQEGEDQAEGQLDAPED